MAKTQEQMDKERIEDVANVARSEASEDAFGQVTSGMWSGIAKGIMAGASIGAVGGLPGVIGGALLGGVAGAIGGGASAYGEESAQRKEFDKQARDAEKLRQEQEKETSKLQRQMTTGAQQAARAGGRASSVKQLVPTTPAAPDAALMSMPVASGRGTQYDAWRQQTYGG
jgi:hypothetical protein